MSDFPSLNDLVSPKNNGPKQRPVVFGQDKGEALTKKMGTIAEQEHEIEAMRFAASIGYPHIDLDKFPIGQQALRQIPEEEAKALQAVCFYATQDEIRLGAIDPMREDVQELLHRLEEAAHAHGALYVISDNSLARVIKLYGTLPIVKPITKDIDIHPEDLDKVKGVVNDFTSLQSQIESTNTTDLVTLLLGAGLTLDASDLHVEAEEVGIVVRLRIDGILHDAATVPKDAYKKLVSRIKLVSSLKINITDAPQDGRFTIRLTEGDVDVRVSTIPTVYGESIVMRLLRQSQEGIRLEDLGLRGSAFDLLKTEIERPNGMIITTGPTGSGKTTTMYAVLKMLNKPGVKIITLEDPVEYKMEGINQSQIEYAKGYTFAKGLRSLLRQDPDIVMVGEIRDLETADISIQAALTGHLMLSTIHTNNAAGAIPRFLSMGVKPFLLAPALNAVIGQRLVRKLCPSCKKEATLTPAETKRVEDLLSTLPEAEKKSVDKKSRTFFTAAGCEICKGIGYKGRLGIYEIFLITDKVEEIVMSGRVSEFAIEAVAKENGMVTMVQDGLLKALDGQTSVDEVFRVIE